MHITSDHIMTGVLALIALAIAVSVYREHKAKSSFNLLDLVMEHIDGERKLSLKRTIIMVGFSLHVFVVVYMLLRGTLTDTGVAAFAGIWILPYLGSVVFGKKASPEEPKP